MQLSERGDKIVRQVAEYLGVPEKALHRWRSEIAPASSAGCVSGDSDVPGAARVVERILCLAQPAGKPGCERAGAGVGE